MANTYEKGGNVPPVRTFSKTKIIAGNYQLLTYVENSMENYLVSLGDVDVLFDKINLEQIGVNREDNYYREIIKKIKYKLFTLIGAKYYPIIRKFYRNLFN